MPTPPKGAFGQFPDHNRLRGFPVTVPRTLFSNRPATNLVPLGDLPRRLAEAEPDRTVLSFGDTLWTRLAFAEAVERRATRLIREGVVAGDFVTVTLPTGPEVHITCFAIWMLGATPAPLSPKLPAAEFDVLVNLAAPRLVIGSSAGTIAGRPVITVDAEKENMLPLHKAPAIAAPSWKVMTSGGSTGRPKLIVDTRPALVDPEVTSLGIEVGDTVLSPAPVHHNAPFSFSHWAIAWGGHIIEMERFDPAETLRLVELHRVRWLYLVPTMMSRIWALPETVRTGFDLSSLEAVVHMAAPCPAWLKRNWIDWLGPDRILEVYAGTESVGACTITGQEWLNHPGSVGQPQVPDSICILDDALQPLPPNEIGTIYFRSPPNRTNNYRYVGSKSAAIDGWETYGDMGSLDGDGYLYLADRRSDMIVSGGINVWPAEIEAALEAHPAIATAVVVGLPHDDLGQTPHAILELVPGMDQPNSGELAAFLASRLARNKHPRSIEISAKPLRDEAGKTRRSAWRDRTVKFLEAGGHLEMLRSAIRP